VVLSGTKPAASYHHLTGAGGSTTSGNAGRSEESGGLAVVCPGPGRASDSFPLQKGLIFESMPLTAEVPFSRPRWLGFPDCP
jgi:hypothetical protein